jgi:hypothetical protein
LQFVRKISGFNQPSKTNERPFMAAVDEIAHASAKFLGSLETSARPKDGEREAALRKARSVERFRKIQGSSPATD